MKKLTYAIIIIAIQVAIINASFKVRDAFLELTQDVGSGTQDMVALVNNEREKAGLNLLTENQTLNVSAKMKCDDMITKKYWDHLSPDGTAPWFFIKKAGYEYHYAGENLVKSIPEGEAMERLMESPSHRENILNPRYTQIGIGRCGEYIVQHFASPK